MKKKIRIEFEILVTKELNNFEESELLKPIIGNIVDVCSETTILDNLSATVTDI
jgi:hypothetical protein